MCSCHLHKYTLQILIVVFELWDTENANAQIQRTQKTQRLIQRFVSPSFNLRQELLKLFSLCLKSSNCCDHTSLLLWLWLRCQQITVHPGHHLVTNSVLAWLHFSQGNPSWDNKWPRKHSALLQVWKTGRSVTEQLLPNRWGSLIAISRHPDAIDFSRQTFHFDHYDPGLAAHFLGLLLMRGLELVLKWQSSDGYRIDCVHPQQREKLNCIWGNEVHKQVNICEKLRV